MSILQFLRIFWARWLTIVIATVAAAVGSTVVSLLVQPRYEATARILLSLSKPDPVTGATANLRNMTPYFDAQRELLRDHRTAGRVVDAFNWASDPNLIRAYQARPASDTRDYRQWLAQRVTDRAEMQIRGSIMEIKFRGPSATEAKVGAEVLRKAYLEESLNDRRNYAAKYAKSYNARAEEARKAAEQAEITKAEYERQSGIVMTDGRADLDSARLASLAAQATAPAGGAAAAAASQASLQLAALDSMIDEQSGRLGPSHPRMMELKRSREQLVRLVAQEEARAKALASGATGAEVISRALQEQKTRVLSQRDKVERVRQLQAQVDLLRSEYQRTAARAAQLSLEAAMADTGSQELGPVIAPNNPVFPNKTLMVGGATGLGFVLGFALALLLELLNRRVRGVEDLNLSEEIHCIGVFEEPAAEARNKLRRMVKSLWPSHRRAVA